MYNFVFDEKFLKLILCIRTDKLAYYFYCTSLKFWLNIYFKFPFANLNNYK